MLFRSFDGVYSGSKAYVLNLSQSLAHQFSDKGLYVQAVLPGATRTEIWERSGKDIDAFPAEMVMDAGDLVDAGSADEYANLRRILDRLPMPYRLIPGNHDERDTMRASFPDHGYLAGAEGFICYTIDDLPLRLIALDSLDVGKIGGLLCDVRLNWLDARLSEARDRPTMIFLHHAPIQTGVRHHDEEPFRGAEAFAAVVARHPQVERVVAGHARQKDVVGDQHDVTGRVG